MIGAGLARRVALALLPLSGTSSWTVAGSASERRYGWQGAGVFRREQTQTWSHNHVETRTEYGVHAFGARVALIRRDDFYGEQARRMQESRACPCGHLGLMHLDDRCRVSDCQCTGWGREFRREARAREACSCGHPAGFHHEVGGCVFPRLASQVHGTTPKDCPCWTYEVRK